MRRPLTGPEPDRSRDEAILGFVAAHGQAYGYPPTYEEIAAHVGLGSRAAVRRRIERLRRDGRIWWVRGSSRTLGVINT